MTTKAAYPSSVSGSGSPRCGRQISSASPAPLSPAPSRRVASVRAVICTRGGYGAQRIVDALDFDAVRADPKLVVGFSDITAVQLALWRGARLVTVHGPGAAWLDDRTPEASAESLRAVLMGAAPSVVRADPGAESGPVAVLGPVATGTFLGGNLCLLTSSIGTRDEPDPDGAILLLEEVDEEPYKVDRMLTHLRRAGLLDGLAGIALGQFTRCVDGWPVSIAEVLADRLSGLGVPVLGGLPIGHGYGQGTVPVGVPATLDGAAGTLTVDPAVRPGAGVEMPSRVADGSGSLAETRP